jgi:CheY-like chemotaxis protein
MCHERNHQHCVRVKSVARGLHHDCDAMAQTELAEQAAPTGTTARVLVIDDDEHILSMLAEVLGVEGYEVVGALDGAAAIGAIRRSRPDVILLDLMMPVLDGYSFLDLYKQLPGPHAPVIVITAAARTAREEVAEKAEEVILKPFSVDHVLQVVNRYTGRPAR